MDVEERLRRLSTNSPPCRNEERPTNFEALTAQAAAMVRLAAVCAVGGPSASISTEVDRAISAGMTATAVVESLSAIAPIVGMPRIVAAAPAIAVALGYPMDLLADDP